MALEISEVKVFLSNTTSGNIVGYGYVVFDKIVQVKISLIKATDGRIFIAWPSRLGKDKDSPYVNLVTFTSAEAKSKIDKVIIDEFNKKVGINPVNKKVETPDIVINLGSSYEPNNDQNNNVPESKNNFEDSDSIIKEESPVQEIKEEPSGQVISWA